MKQLAFNYFLVQCYAKVSRDNYLDVCVNMLENAFHAVGREHSKTPSSHVFMQQA